MKSLKEILDHKPCKDGRDWLLSKDRTPKEAWEQCPRGDWLLWVAGKAGMEKRLLVQCAVACARISLKYVPDGEDRPRLAIEAAENWLAHPSLSTAAVAAAAGAAAGAAAEAIEVTGRATWVVIEADSWAAWAARAAEAAAGAAANAEAGGTVWAAWAARAVAAVGTGGAKAHKQCADLVRSIIPFELVVQ